MILQWTVHSKKKIMKKESKEEENKCPLGDKQMRH